MVDAARSREPAPALYCAAAEAEDEAPLAAFLPAGFAVLPQGGGDLGRRLARVLGRLLRRHPAALAIGSDCPELTPDLLREALAALDRSGTVLGPTRDGGYWAIGLDAPRPEIFRDVPWSTAEVADLTRERLAALGLRAEELPLLADLDRFDDLRAWAGRPNPCFRRTLEWWRARAAR